MNSPPLTLIDSHCHLYLPEFKDDLDDVMQRAENEGVKKFYLPAIDSETHASMLDLEKKFPGKCLAMIGLHPCSVKSNFSDELSIVEEWLVKRSFVAIGEIGLDFYWDRTFEQQQYEALRLQITWAIQKNLPIVIHSRNSMKETIDVIRREQKGGLHGIFHCFSDSYESAKAIVDLGFYLGVGGILTYKKSTLPEVIEKIGLENVVLETDSPYLTPAPFRGKRNESSYLKYVVAKLAAIKGVSTERVAEITTANAEKIFGSNEAM